MRSRRTLSGEGKKARSRSGLTCFLRASVSSFVSARGGWERRHSAGFSLIAGRAAAISSMYFLIFPVNLPFGCPLLKKFLLLFCIRKNVKISIIPNRNNIFCQCLPSHFNKVNLIGCFHHSGLDSIDP